MDFTMNVGGMRRRALSGTFSAKSVLCCLKNDDELTEMSEACVTYKK